MSLLVIALIVVIVLLLIALCFVLLLASPLIIFRSEIDKLIRQTNKGIDNYENSSKEK